VQNKWRLKKYNRVVYTQTIAASSDEQMLGQPMSPGRHDPVGKARKQTFNLFGTETDRSDAGRMAQRNCTWNMDR
jgi:hypothetical protein